MGERGKQRRVQTSNGVKCESESSNYVEECKAGKVKKESEAPANAMQCNESCDIGDIHRVMHDAGKDESETASWPR